MLCPPHFSSTSLNEEVFSSGAGIFGPSTALGKRFGRPQDCGFRRRRFDLGANHGTNAARWRPRRDTLRRISCIQDWKRKSQHTKSAHRARKRRIHARLHASRLGWRAITVLMTLTLYSSGTGGAGIFATLTATNTLI